MKIEYKPSGDFEKMEEGLHPAVLISIVGVGTHATPFTNEDGTTKYQNKVILTWATEGGLISNEYTASLHEKSKLRSHLETWRGKKFDDIELENGVDIKKFLGEQCTLQVMLNKNDYPTVNMVMPKTKDWNTDKDLVHYAVSEHNDEDFDKLPDWQKKKVMASFEWIKKFGNESAEKESKKATFSDGTPVPDDSEEMISLDDIPF